MGMFDKVKRDPVICPNCNKGVIDDFQTKSGFCNLFGLTEDQLVEDAKRFNVDCLWYYGYCPECMTRVDFEYQPGHWEQSFETAEDRRKNQPEL